MPFLIYFKSFTCRPSCNTRFQGNRYQIGHFNDFFPTFFNSCFSHFFSSCFVYSAVSSVSFPLPLTRRGRPPGLKQFHFQSFFFYVTRVWLQQWRKSPPPKYALGDLEWRCEPERRRELKRPYLHRKEITFRREKSNFGIPLYRARPPFSKDIFSGK